MFDLVGKPEDRFSHVTAHWLYVVGKVVIGYKIQF